MKWCQGFLWTPDQLLQMLVSYTPKNDQNPGNRRLIYKPYSRFSNCPTNALSWSKTDLSHSLTLNSGLSPTPSFFAFHDPNIFRKVWASYTGRYLSFGIIWRFVMIKFRLWVFNEIPQKGWLISGPCMLSEGTWCGYVPLLVVLVLTAWWRWCLPSVFTVKGLCFHLNCSRHSDIMPTFSCIFSC